MIVCKTMYKMSENLKVFLKIWVYAGTWGDGIMTVRKEQKRKKTEK